MRALLADDEFLARERLKKLLRVYPNLSIVGEAENGKMTLESVQALKPDVLFLDIRMPLMDGLKVAESVSQQASPPMIVFCTAYDEYALTAFQTHAVGYLVKPIDAASLAQVMAKINKLLPVPSGAVAVAGGFVSRKGKDIVRLQDSEVLALKADHKYVVAVTATGEFLLDDPLKDIEQTHGEVFMRVHRNALVNKYKITALVKSDAGFDVVLENSVHIPVSRRLLAEVKDAIKNNK